MKTTEKTLRDLIAIMVTGLGYEFVGCEMQGQGHSGLLRIYIDSEKGVNVDDCSKVSRQVSAMLDVEDPIQGRYTLEVSSPGLNRPLFELAQYQKFLGQQIKVRLLMPINDRRNFTGILLQVKEDNVYLSVEQQEVVIPFTNIEKAKVVADIAMKSGGQPNE